MKITIEMICAADAAVRLSNFRSMRYASKYHVPIMRYMH